MTGLGLGRRVGGVGQDPGFGVLWGNAHKPHRWAGR